MKRGTVSCLCVLKSGSSWEVEETGETEETGYPPCISPVGRDALGASFSGWGQVCLLP